MSPSVCARLPQAIMADAASRVVRTNNGDRGRRAEEGVLIHHEVCGKFERAGDMVHRLLCIIAHDERVRGERF